MKIRRIITLLWIVGLVSPAVPTLAQDEIPSVKVALILMGRADDVSWNQASFEGMINAVEALEGRITVELMVVEQIYEPVDIEPTLIDFARQEYDLIIGHGYRFQDLILKVADDYPDVNFAVGAGLIPTPNVGVYDVKLEQGGYLMGLIAGHLTESGIVGVTGGVDLAEIHRGHVAFVLGALAANPAVKVLNNFVGDLNDITAARDAALSQIGAGADVLWHSGGDIGQGVLSVCEEEDVLCLGNTADQNDLAPGNSLASFVYHWEVIYQQMIEETVSGEFGSKFYWIDFSNNGVSVVFKEDMLEDTLDEDLQAMLDEVIRGYIDGSLDLGDLDAYQLEDESQARGKPGLVRISTAVAK